MGVRPPVRAGARRPDPKRPALAVAGVAAAAIAILLLAYLLQRGSGQPRAQLPPQETIEAARQARDSLHGAEQLSRSLLSSRAAGPPQRFDSKPASVLAAGQFARPASTKLDDRAPGAQLAKVDDMLSLEGPYTVIDSRTFAAQDRVIVLAGVEGPERDTVCLDSNGFPFACGLSARAALHNLIARTGLSCRVTRPLDAETVEADCSGPAGDMAEAMAKGGWLRPNSGNGPTSTARHAAAANARQTGAGLWNGDWRYRPSPSGG